MFTGHIAAAHWWGPLGWLYRNTPGNLAASALAFLAGWFVKGRQVVRQVHNKLDLHAAALDELHRFHRIGRHADTTE